MKTILFLLCSAVPVMAIAQSSIKVSAGLNYNSIPKLAMEYDKPGVNAVGSINYNYTIKNKWELGLGVLITKLSATKILIGSANGISGDEYKLKMNFGNPVFAIGLHANRLFDIKHSTLYAGLYVGYLSLTHSDNQKKETLGGLTLTTESTDPKGSGFSAGIQVGYDYSLDRHLSIGLEIAPRYASITRDGYYPSADKTTYSLIYIPTQIGLTYKF